jgi:hypothetical protein
MLKFIHVSYIVWSYFFWGYQGNLNVHFVLLTPSKVNLHNKNKSNTSNNVNVSILALLNWTLNFSFHEYYKLWLPIPHSHYVMIGIKV